MRKIKSWKIFIESVDLKELKCLNCNNDLQPGTKFCTKCGTRVGTKDEKSPERTKNEEESSFSQKLRKILNIINDEKNIGVFKNGTGDKVKETLQDIEQVYKTDKVKGESLLDIQIKFVSNVIKNLDVEREWLQKKLSQIEQENIDLKNKNDESNKKTFDETFRPLLDNCKKIYQSLRDEKIKSKLDDLVNIVFKNYSDGNYYSAVGGASRLIVTFFADGKTFSGWNNKFTEYNLDNTSILGILDTYKKIIQEGK